jgi:hypothetical protein
MNMKIRTGFISFLLLVIGNTVFAQDFRNVLPYAKIAVDGNYYLSGTHVVMDLWIYPHNIQKHYEGITDSMGYTFFPKFHMDDSSGNFPIYVVYNISAQYSGPVGNKMPLPCSGSRTGSGTIYQPFSSYAMGGVLSITCN